MLAMCSSGLGLSRLLKDPQWGGLADQFQHRAWEGCTAWDLIQPSFMFIVGVAMPFAFALRQERGDSWGRQFLHALSRAVKLILIGVFLDSIGHTFITLQFIRVLQQIALGYLIVFLVMNVRPRLQVVFAALLLVSHSLAFTLYQSETPWEKDTNIGTWIDKHAYVDRSQLDGYLEIMPLSEGGYVTINAISAAATILFGVLCGELLRSGLSPWRKVGVMVACGLGGLTLGLALSGGHMIGQDWPVIVPAVKKIWTASFGIYAAGWTFLTLAAFYATIDVIGWKRWAFPLVVVGMNSIAIYVLYSTVRGRIDDSLKPFLTVPLTPLDDWAPVVMAIAIVFVQWLFCYWLYRHKIFWKV
jgi:predicted acyltransferase